MKKLILLRHAKSSWSHSNLADHDRPLNKRGKADAPVMGRLLRREGLVPDLIISSTAVRASRTAEIVAINAGYEKELQYTRELYHGYPEGYVDAARNVSSQDTILMMVGHNPGLAELVELLSGTYERMPTATIAVFQLPIVTWAEWDLDTPAEPVAIWRPKEID